LISAPSATRPERAIIERWRAVIGRSAGFYEAPAVVSSPNAERKASSAERAASNAGLGTPTAEQKPRRTRGRQSIATKKASWGAEKSSNRKAKSFVGCSKKRQSQRKKPCARRSERGSQGFVLQAPEFARCAQRPQARRQQFKTAIWPAASQETRRCLRRGMGQVCLSGCDVAPEPDSCHPRQECRQQ
jgi:hypothetical protein